MCNKKLYGDDFDSSDSSSNKTESKDKVLKCSKIATIKQCKVNGVTNVANHKLTEYFPVRRSVRKTKKEVMEQKQKDLELAIEEQREDGLTVIWNFFPLHNKHFLTSKVWMPFRSSDFLILEIEPNVKIISGRIFRWKRSWRCRFSYVSSRRLRSRICRWISRHCRSSYARSSLCSRPHCWLLHVLLPTQQPKLLVTLETNFIQCTFWYHFHLVLSLQYWRNFWVGPIGSIGESFSQWKSHHQVHIHWLEASSRADCQSGHYGGRRGHIRLWRQVQGVAATSPVARTLIRPHSYGLIVAFRPSFI